MGRKKITLQDWCNEDRQLKMEFFKDESNEKKDNRLLNWDGDKNKYVSVLSGSWIVPATLFTNQESLNSYLDITQECFEKLKRRYKVFKKNKRDHGLIKKQYSFKPAIANQIKKMKEDNHLTREEYAIEYLINSYLNKKNANDIYAKINPKDIRLQILEQENNNLKNEIQRFNQSITVLDTRCMQLLNMLAESDLTKDFYLSIIKENNIGTLKPTIDQNAINKRVQDILFDLRPKFEAKNK